MYVHTGDIEIKNIQSVCVRERERGRERARAIEGEQILTFQDVRVNSIIIDFFCLLCLRGLQTYNIQADK